MYSTQTCSLCKISVKQQRKTDKDLDNNVMTCAERHSEKKRASPSV